MTLIDIRSGKPLQDDLALRIIDAQTAGLVQELDRVAIRRALARAIFDDRVAYYRFDIGDAFHPLDSERRCALCDGYFPKRGRAYGVTLPANLGGEVKPLHAQCFLGAADWMQ